MRFNNIDAVATPTNADFFISIEKGDGIKVYPNPASENLHFLFSDKNRDRKIQIFNTLGQLIYNDDANDLNKSVEIDKLKTKGFVIARVVDGLDISRFKVIINR